MRKILNKIFHQRSEKDLIKQKVYREWKKLIKDLKSKEELERIFIKQSQIARKYAEHEQRIENINEKEVELKRRQERIEETEKVLDTRSNELARRERRVNKLYNQINK